MPNNFKVPRGISIDPLRHSTPAVKQRNTVDTSFNELLQKQIGSSSLRFSAHAEKRLAQSGIKLSAKQLSTLENAVEQVRKKGSKESLVLMKDLAFVVSVDNKTVITAIDQGRMKDNIFTISIVRL